MKAIPFIIQTVQRWRRFLFALGAALCVMPNAAFPQSPGAPGRMIEISATIYDFRYDKETQFGIFYQFDSTSGDFLDSNLYLPGSQQTSESAIPALDLSGTFATLDAGVIEYNIKTAIQEGWGTVISNPSVLASDGEQAKLISGERVPITEVTLKGAKTTLKSELRDTGIKLIVTPHIYKGDYVLLKLEIESSEITRFEEFFTPDSARYELPVVATRNIKSVVIIPNEKKLYVGGLYTDLTTDTTRKVPIIGDLPGLGYFMRGFHKGKSRSETVFQITPIIRDPGFGITTQDVSIFSDLLEPEGAESIIDQYHMLQQVSGEKTKSASDMIPSASIPVQGMQIQTPNLNAGDDDAAEPPKTGRKSNKRRLRPIRLD